MRLDQLQVVVCPRNPWESIDLGFSLVRQWWRPLATLWLANILPLVIMIHLFCYYQEWWRAGWIIWWLKPLFDRLILYWVSRALFGERTRIREGWQQLPRLITSTHLLHSLISGRLELFRSFALPISQLEGLTGQPWQQRITLLNTKNRHYAEWLTVVCFGFEWSIYLSLCVLLYVMIPVTEQIELKTLIYTSYNAPWWIDLSSAIFSVLALSIAETLYVVGGFTLYLNRRIHLEGWDIELNFRHLAGKLRKT